MATQDTSEKIVDAFRKMLPEGIGYACHSINRRYAVFEYEEEEFIVRKAVERRRLEFNAGRSGAREALVKIGAQRVPILRGEDDLPVWPEGFLGVISHSRTHCGALASRLGQYRALGLDLEQTNRLSSAAVKKVVHPDEWHWAGADQKLGSLVFSAKEAFFKMQFPIWRTHGNFHELVFAAPVHKADFGYLTVKSLKGQFPIELQELVEGMKIHFAFVDDLVVTACWLSRI